jgi:hypothetical protein
MLMNLLFWGCGFGMFRGFGGGMGNFHITIM